LNESLVDIVAVWPCRSTPRSRTRSRWMHPPTTTDGLSEQQPASAWAQPGKQPQPAPVTAGLRKLPTIYKTASIAGDVHWPKRTLVAPTEFVSS